MKHKYLAPALSSVLVASLAVTGTLAYLNATTNKVTNTFTFSEDDAVKLSLIETVFDETYDEDGLNVDGAKDAILEMVPGHVKAKNPTITVESADCYLFMDVIEKENEADSGVPFYEYEIATGVPDYTWVKVDGTNNPTGTVSYILNYCGSPAVVSKDASFGILADKLDDKLGDYNPANPTDTTPVQGSVSINTALTQDDLMAVKDGTDAAPELSFVAYAVQAANITPAEVTALFISEFKSTT